MSDDKEDVNSPVIPNGMINHGKISNGMIAPNALSQVIVNTQPMTAHTGQVFKINNTHSFSKSCEARPFPYDIDDGKFTNFGVYWDRPNSQIVMNSRYCDTVETVFYDTNDVPEDLVPLVTIYDDRIHTGSKSLDRYESARSYYIENKGHFRNSFYADAIEDLIEMGIKYKRKYEAKMEED